MEDKELKAIQEAIARQTTNNYPKIYIQDLESGKVFEYGKNCHDRLVISEDGRCLHYENLQNGDGSSCGQYKFYYEKSKIETEMDKIHAFDIDRWDRTIRNEKLSEDKELKDHIHDLNNTLLNLQLFLKDLRDSFHKEDEVYEEIDKKLKELGGDR